jgi:hypothetical protein
VLKETCPPAPAEVRPSLPRLWGERPLSGGFPAVAAKRPCGPARFTGAPPLGELL